MAAEHIFLDSLIEFTILINNEVLQLFALSIEFETAMIRIFDRSAKSAMPSNYNNVYADKLLNNVNKRTIKINIPNTITYIKIKNHND